MALWHCGTVVANLRFRGKAAQHSYRAIAVCEEENNELVFGFKGILFVKRIS